MKAFAYACVKLQSLLLIMFISATVTLIRADENISEQTFPEGEQLTGTNPEPVLDVQDQAFSEKTSSEEPFSDQALPEETPLPVLESPISAGEKSSIFRTGIHGSSMTLGNNLIYYEDLNKDVIDGVKDSVLYGGILSSVLLNSGYIGLHMFGGQYSPPVHLLAPAIALAGAAGHSLWYYHMLRNLINTLNAGSWYWLPKFFLPVLGWFHNQPNNISARSMLTVYLVSMAASLADWKREQNKQGLNGEIRLSLKGDVSRHFLIKAQLMVHDKGFYILTRLPQTNPDIEQGGYQKLASILESLELTHVSLLPYVHKGANKLKVICYDAISGSVSEIHLKGSFGDATEAPWLLHSVVGSQNRSDISNAHSMLSNEVIEIVADAILALSERDREKDGHHSEFFEERDSELYEYTIPGTDIGLLPRTGYSTTQSQFGSTGINDTSGKFIWDINSWLGPKLTFDDGHGGEGYTQWKIPSFFSAFLAAEASRWGQHLGYQATSKLISRTSDLTGLSDYMQTHRRGSLTALYQAIHTTYPWMENRIISNEVTQFASVFSSVYDEQNPESYVSELDITMGPGGSPDPCIICMDAPAETTNEQRQTPCCRQNICMPCVTRTIFQNPANTSPDGHRFTTECSNLHDSNHGTLSVTCPHCRQATIRARVTRWARERPAQFQY